MSLKNIVVTGYSWEASTSNLPALPMDTAYTFTDVTSQKVKADGKNILLSSTIAIAGTDTTQQFTFTGSGVLSGSAQYVKENLIPVVLENDSVNCAVICINNSTIPPVSIPGTITVKISNAGQSVVKGE